MHGQCERARRWASAELDGELSSFERDRDEFAQPSVSAIVNGEPLSLAGRTKPFAESLETLLEVKLQVASVLVDDEMPAPG